MIKRFFEVINIITSHKPSVTRLNDVQYAINYVIHHNLQNFMLPKKVKEVIDILTSQFVKMAEIRGLSSKVEDRRKELLQQGHEIITKLQPYTRSDYTIEEYAEAYQTMFNRAVAMYLKHKKECGDSIPIDEAMKMLSSAKQLQVDWNEVLGDRKYKLKDYAFRCMISELKEYITKSI